MLRTNHNSYWEQMPAQRTDSQGYRIKGRQFSIKALKGLKHRFLSHVGM